MTAPSVRAPDQPPAALRPVEDEVEDTRASRLASQLVIRLATRLPRLLPGLTTAGLDPPDLALGEEILPDREHAVPLAVHRICRVPWLRQIRQVRPVGTEHRLHSARLPPRTGLPPVREHVAHLPQPPTPEELLRPFHAAPGTANHPLAHFHGVVVPPHVSPPGVDVRASCPAHDQPDPRTTPSPSVPDRERSM